MHCTNKTYKFMSTKNDLVKPPNCLNSMEEKHDGNGKSSSSANAWGECVCACVCSNTHKIFGMKYILPAHAEIRTNINKIKGAEAEA